jgi:hypothetical protein
MSEENERYTLSNLLEKERVGKVDSEMGAIVLTHKGILIRVLGIRILDEKDTTTLFGTTKFDGHWPNVIVNFQKVGDELVISGITMTW